MADTHSLHLRAIENSTTQFLEIWHHYDNAGRGYIEGRELQSFIRELQQARKATGSELSDGMKALVEKYDQSADGKIEMADLAQILPTEENFFLFFRQQLKSSAEFMETWRIFDADHSGFIEADELKSFLRDLLKKANRPFDEVKLEEYTQTTLKMFDSNNDGKLGLAEMARLLPDKENFLLRFQGVNMSSKEFDDIFEFFDQDGNGYIDENELDALLKHLCEKNKEDLDIQNVSMYKKSIMALSDGGKLFRKDLALILCAEEL
ncbi:calbindin isoform X1 [Callorhinchus milii]|uniref:Calbindin n=3 Tax=Callorhinchus milii TaxID=7868 RepID=A0A4W3HVV0_CALMI|nr:calbindin isoform X1 [Callorhinchus milii]|eukprot:gi/632969970/ref/XP_007901385.1/ PREDICTED: calbindin isoform X1 [Callorhinchus milii]